MKARSLLITLISVVIIFFIISSVQQEIKWPLIMLLLIVGFLINLCMSVLSSKKKSQ